MKLNVINTAGGDFVVTLAATEREAIHLIDALLLGAVALGPGSTSGVQLRMISNELADLTSLVHRSDAAQLDPETLRVDTYFNESGVSAKVTHLPTKLVAVSEYQPSAVAAKNHALSQLAERVAAYEKEQA